MENPDKPPKRVFPSYFSITSLLIPIIEKFKHSQKEPDQFSKSRGNDALCLH